KKTAWQMDSLKQSRQDLDVLRKDVQDFYKSHAEIAQLRDKLGADRVALEAFAERMAALSIRAPELEAKMDTILGKMALVEEGTQKAAGLNATDADLNALKSDVRTAQERIGIIKSDEATVAEQETRFAELLSASKTIGTEVAERMRQMQALSEEIARSTGVKDEMLAELDRVQSR